MNNKYYLIISLVALTALGLYFFDPSGDFKSETGSDDKSATANPTTGPNQTVLPGAVGSLGPKPVITEEPFLGLNNIKEPATCQIGGEINFSASDSFSSADSRISWQNVDSQGRLIKWRVAPSDNLAIGPNLFANLAVPSGQYHNLTVRLPDRPIAKNYILTASITYGQIIQGDVKVKETDCTGQVKVNLNF